MKSIKPVLMSHLKAAHRSFQKKVEVTLWESTHGQTVITENKTNITNTTANEVLFNVNHSLVVQFERFTAANEVLFNVNYSLVVQFERFTAEKLGEKV